MAEKTGKRAPGALLPIDFPFRGRIESSRKKGKRSFFKRFCRRKEEIITICLKKPGKGLLVSRKSFKIAIVMNQPHPIKSPAKLSNRKPVSPAPARSAALALFAVLSAALPFRAVFAAENQPSFWTNGEAALSCQNLKDAFEEYRGDMDLTHTAFAKSLLNLSQALRAVLENPAASQKAALSKIIQETENAVSASYADQDTVSQKGFDIQDALDECLK